jgi:hypothetical protein
MQAPQITHEEYCRIIGELYIDAHLRINHLEKQVSSTNPLPLVQSLQQQIAKLQTENSVLTANIEQAEDRIKELETKA